MKLREFIAPFEAYCPKELALEKDFCGLQIGSLDAEIQKVLFTLDVRPQVVEEAIRIGADLIFVKHAPIFRPINQLTDNNPQSKMFLDILQKHINVYVAHTNIDVVADGLNDWFCEALGLNEVEILQKTQTKSLKKLIVYVPKTHADQLRQALGEAKAGMLGNYHHMSYTSNGQGRFIPSVQANPTIGQAEQLSIVAEEKIEFIVENQYLPSVLQTMYRVHPYEEPAFEVYDLNPESNGTKVEGIGRIGHLAKPLELSTFIDRVKSAFHLKHLKVIKASHISKRQLISKVAICGGSAEKLYRDALAKEADVYITGDVYYHTAHDMQESGLIVLDPGHHIEVLFADKLKKKYEQWKTANKWQVDLMVSTVNTDPFEII